MFRWIFCLLVQLGYASVHLGVDVFFDQGLEKTLEGKQVGLITNHTGVDRFMCPTAQRLLVKAKKYKVVAFFSPEHGIDGRGYAWENIEDIKHESGVPIYSLHGKTRRPTEEMLKGIDVLLYDIQGIGARSYTYETTLYYIMEEAAHRKIEVIVLDRPNPINGIIVDGPMMEEEWRSIIGYINIPYCHGMTIGELAHFFNEEYKIGCKLTVIPMKGWKRSMSYKDTGLSWIPPSPHIPEPDTPFYYSSTGILGELKILNIGVGYTLPFKVVGAPWMDAKKFTSKLNEQKLPGVTFIPFHFRPFYGLYKGKDCNGTMIQITDQLKYRPLAVQYALLGIVKSMYPSEFLELIDTSPTSKNLFCKANGTEMIYTILKTEKYATWKLIEFQKKSHAEFLNKRKKHLISDYN